MKNLKLVLGTLVLMLIISCQNEPLEGDFQTGTSNCEQAAQNTAQAALNFLAVNDDTYTQLCIAYRNALEAQIQACGDEDGSLQAVIDALGDCSNNTQPGSPVVGTWLLTSWIGEEPIDLNNDGTENIDFLEEIDCYDNETLVFVEDGTGAAISTAFAEIFFEIVVGTENDVTWTVECIDAPETTAFTWTEENGIVSITDEFGTNDWMLDGNELTITIPEGFTSFSEDASVTIIQDLTFVYTKQ